jgi:hypothetical protein
LKDDKDTVIYEAERLEPSMAEREKKKYSKKKKKH